MSEIDSLRQRVVILEQIYKDLEKTLELLKDNMELMANPIILADKIKKAEVVDLGYGAVYKEEKKRGNPNWVRRK